MRRSLFLFAPLGLAMFAFACEDDPTNPSSPDLPEAGTFDVQRPENDSSTPPQQDAQPDSPSTPGVVTVLATRRSGFASDVTVVFHDAQGAVTESKKTGADGKAASTSATPPAMATIIFGEGTDRRRLLTWTGTAGGDVLPAVMPEDVDLGVVDITIATPPPDAGTLNYTSYVGGCDLFRTTTSWQHFIGQECARGGGALLVRAEDTNAATIGFSFKKPFALTTDGGTATASMTAWVAPVQTTVSVTNPGNTGCTGIFQQIANNTAFPQWGFIDGTERTFEAAGPTFADGYNAAISCEGAGNFAAKRVMGRRTLPATTTFAFDAAQLPPEITGAAVDTADLKRPIAKWTSNMAALKGGVARLQYFDGNTESSTIWTIIVAASASQAKAPALPATFDTILPVADSGGWSWDTEPVLAFADSNLLADYAAFRKGGGLFLPTAEENADFDEAVLPAPGDMKISSYRPIAK